MTSLTEITKWVQTNFKLQVHCIQEPQSLSSEENDFGQIFIKQFIPYIDLSSKYTTIYRYDYFVGYLYTYNHISRKGYIFGPARLINFPDFSKSGYASIYPIRQKQRDAFYEYMNTLPFFDEDEFLSIATCVHEHISGDKISIADIHIVDRNVYHSQSDKLIVDHPYPNTNTEDLAQMWRVNVEACNYIRLGEPQLLSQLFRKKKMTYHLGLISDVVENYKITACMAISFAMQAAIEGGLDNEIALHTFDFYMLSLSHISEIQDILALTASAQCEYALRVQQLRIPDSYPPILVKVIKYILSHLHEPINAATVASATQTSQSYLSRLFKKYTGMATSEYIRYKKIEVAKELLKKTEMSISDIAFRLAFSSQPQFQKAFKQLTGLTPREYRIN